LIVGEPFGLLSAEEAAEWREAFLLPQLPVGTPCLSLPQPLLALLAHGAGTDGIVVNLGQREVVAVPCLGGRTCREAACCQEGIGGAMLTNRLYQQLFRRGFDVELTCCRDLKESHCFVAPRELRSAGEQELELLAPPIEVSCGGLRLQLGIERCSVPEEVLFPAGRQGLPGLVLTAASRAVVRLPRSERPAAWGRLLAGVIVVGGTSELPGLRGRLQAELRARTKAQDFLAAEQLPEAPEVVVLQPSVGPGGTSVVRGGHLAAVATCALGLLPTMLPEPEATSTPEARVPCEEVRGTRVPTPSCCDWCSKLCILRCTIAWQKALAVRAGLVLAARTAVMAVARVVAAGWRRYSRPADPL